MRRHFIGTILTGYALSVIAVTIFPIHPHPASYWAGDPFSDMLRWIPGDVDGPSFTLNVIMFIPFGILLPLLWRGSDGYLPMLLRSGLASATIELVQLVLGLTVGSRRTVDINDLIANTAGALLGLLILHLAVPSADHRARAASSGRP